MPDSDDLDALRDCLVEVEDLKKILQASPARVVDCSNELYDYRGALILIARLDVGEASELAKNVLNIYRSI